MPRKISLWCLCGILALGLFIPSVGSAQQCSAAASINLAATSPAPAPEMNPSPEKPITLEELKLMVGAQNVCGAPCGFGQPKCYVSCGDAASCYHGYCIYL